VRRAAVCVWGTDCRSPALRQAGSYVASYTCPTPSFGCGGRAPSSAYEAAGASPKLPGAAPESYFDGAPYASAATCPELRSLCRLGTIGAMKRPFRPVIGLMRVAVARFISTGLLRTSPRWKLSQDRQIEVASWPDVCISRSALQQKRCTPAGLVRLGRLCHWRLDRCRSACLIASTGGFSWSTQTDAYFHGTGKAQGAPTCIRYPALRCPDRHPASRPMPPALLPASDLTPALLPV
jgi:hypothetical protein